MTISKVNADIIVIGGGSAGTFAAINAKKTNPKAKVVVLDKGPIETSGAIGRGMDALNIVFLCGLLFFLLHLSSQYIHADEMAATYKIILLLLNQY